MRRVYAETGYVMCPHTTVGHLAMEAYGKAQDEDFTRVTVGTAHPAKFQGEVERILRIDLPLPSALAKLARRKAHVTDIAPTLPALTDALAA